MRKVVYIILVLCAVLVSCGKKPKVIPVSKMVGVYSEMLLTDQWLNQNYAQSRVADTSLVYEPILSKYGYTSEDYRASVDYYMDHDKKFTEIFDKLEKALREHVGELRSEEKMRFQLDSIRMVRSKRVYPHAETYYGESIAWRDSIELYRDSTTGRYLIRALGMDTTFSGPFLVIDTLSISLRDSLKVAADSLNAVMNEKKDAVVPTPIQGNPVRGRRLGGDSNNSAVKTEDLRVKEL